MMMHHSMIKIKIMKARAFFVSRQNRNRKRFYFHGVWLRDLLRPSERWFSKVHPRQSTRHVV